MSRRASPHGGLTLVEVLLSLALTSSLLVLSGGWIRTALEREATSVTRRDRAIRELALDRIEDLLRSGDWQAEPRPAGERLAASESRLSILSRWPGHGAVDATIVFDPTSAELRLEFARVERVLADGLADVRFDVRQAATDTRVVVEITLIAADGTAATREVLVR